MPTLTLRYGLNPIQSYQIESGRTITIGRKETNDIVIENLGVSGYHAKIDALDNKFLLTDLQSKNGTFINDKLIVTQWLKHGDIITIGKHTLSFLYEDGEVQPPEAGDVSMEQTMVMQTGKYQELLSKSFSRSNTEVGRESVGVLTYLAGGHGEIKLTRKLTRIGKDPTSDVVVGGLMMGKTAATVSNRPSGYFLSFVGGMTKPKVNGETVKESVKLEEFDVIELGSVKLQFIHDYIYKKEI